MKSLAAIKCTNEILEALRSYIQERNDFIDNFDQNDYLEEYKTFWGKVKFYVNPDKIKTPKGIFLFVSDAKPYKKQWLCNLETVYNQMRVSPEILADQDVFELLKTVLSDEQLKTACKNN